MRPPREFRLTGRCLCRSLEFVYLCPRRFWIFEPERIDLRVRRLVRRHVILGEDGGHGAYGLASTAVDAFIGVDEQLTVNALFVINAVGRADLQAGLR